MKRRGFLAALAALPFAPKALDAIAAMAPPPSPLVGLIDVLQSTSIHGLSGLTIATWNKVPPGYIFGIDGRVWRRMQEQLRDGFDTPVEEWARFETQT